MPPRFKKTNHCPVPHTIVIKALSLYFYITTQFLQSQHVLLATHIWANFLMVEHAMEVQEMLLHFLQILVQILPMICLESSGFHQPLIKLIGTGEL